MRQNPKRPWACTAALLNNPDDPRLLPCAREPGHKGDHWNADTGFAWHPNCSYRPDMLWGAKGDGWVILDDDYLVELFTRVLEEPHRWVVEHVADGWKFRCAPALAGDSYNHFRGTGFQIELLARAWQYVTTN